MQSKVPIIKPGQLWDIRVYSDDKLEFLCSIYTLGKNSRGNWTVLNLIPHSRHFGEIEEYMIIPSQDKLVF